MLTNVVALIRGNLDTFVDRLVLRLSDAVPGYARLEGAALRVSVEGFTSDLLDAVEKNDSTELTHRMTDTSHDRVEQGFSLAEYLRALFLAVPVCREMVRELGPRNDPELASGFNKLEERLFELTAMAANIYTEISAGQLRSKNLELNRLNQLLQARERALEQEGHKVNRALASANEFNRRVIESLSSGLMAVDASTRKINLFSQRMESIFEIPAEQALGRDAVEVFSKVKGIDHGLIIKSVQTSGTYPLTKLQITTLRGHTRTVFVRAQQLYGLEGESEGTVFVVDDVSERELLIDSFSRYVSRDLVARLLARAEPLGLEAEKRICTVLFADIRGFTGIAERLAPEALHRLLNNYLHVMIEGIVEHGGFIDKFVGDKVMALFAGPRPEKQSAAAAVMAAQSILRGISELNQTRAQAGEPPIEVGIGINTGPVVVGNVGDLARMDFTAIGDAVNVADRLQSLAEGGQVLVGGATAAMLSTTVPLQPLGTRTVKGRAAPVEVFAAAKA